MTTLRPRGRRLESEDDLSRLVRSMSSVAVVGMKDESRLDEAAYSIPAMLQALGVRVWPVNPKIESSLGLRAWPDLASVPEAFDLVDVFRRISAIPSVVDQVLALPEARRPAAVWLQSGIRHDEATARLLEAGIDVVSDRCLGVYAGRHRRS